MPDIASVLKEEIARIARKELRAETEKLRKASTQYRSEIAALKRRLAALEQQYSRLHRVTGPRPAPPSITGAGPRSRFSAKGVRALRQRLELSAADMGILLGVSAQTIYNWEAGNTRPRPPQIDAIAALRRATKREIVAHLSTH